MERTYRGSCHCGTVRFEADIDIDAGTFKCNCEMCTKTRTWGAIVTPEAFRLISGEEALLHYQPDQIHHVFCRHCGVRPVAWGENPAPGGKFYAIRVNCLDDVDWEQLMAAPVTYFDGRNDHYDRPPEETRHL
jgi:hypothetical protein